MIREINRNNETNWHEKIQLEMNLQDLQILYDCLGAVPNKYLIEKYKYTSLNYIDSSICGDITSDLYESLNKIISEHNGVTDDNAMINSDIELVILKGE
jgi:hypothetical protein